MKFCKTTDQIQRKTFIDENDAWVTFETKYLGQ